MEEDAAATPSPEDGLCALWKLSGRRSRKSGCSNIFTGVNLQQLRRLFRTAGDRQAEHRAKLVWQGRAGGGEGEDRGTDGGDDRGDEAGLAQALVGLRVRARSKTGIRAEGHREQTWPRASGHLRPDESTSGNAVDGEDAGPPGPGGILLATGKDVPEKQNPFKPSSWRSGVTRQEGARDSERYLHRILH